MRTITIKFKYKDANYIHSKTYNEDGPLGYRVPEVFEEAREQLGTTIKRMMGKEFTITGWRSWARYS